MLKHGGKIPMITESCMEPEIYRSPYSFLYNRKFLEISNTAISFYHVVTSRFQPGPGSSRG